MGSFSSSIRCIFEDAAYGAQVGVLECQGARVAVVLRRGALEAVALLPGAADRSDGLSTIIEWLSVAARAPRAEPL